MLQFDVNLFRIINGLAGQSSFWDNFFVFFTIAGYWLLWLLLLLVLILTCHQTTGFGWRLTHWLKKPSAWLGFNWNLPWQVILASGLGYAMSQVIGVMVSRSRPFLTLDSVQQLISEPHIFKSFPSDHALLSFIVALVVWKYHRRWGMLFFILAGLIAFSRVYVGVHYPLDILGGALLAWLSSWLAVKYIKS